MAWPDWPWIPDFTTDLHHCLADVINNVWDPKRCVALYTATDPSRGELNIVFMTSSVHYSDMRGVLHLATSGYPLGWSRAINRCRILVPVDSVVTWYLLDVRGRTINMAARCGYRLLLANAAQRMSASSFQRKLI